MNTIKNEIKRIKSLCSNEITAKENINKYLTHLENNFGFNKQLINNITKNNNKNKNKNNKIKKFYMSIPFINENINKHINKILRKEKLPIILTHKSKSLQNELRNDTDTKTSQCKNTPCFVNNPNICNTKCIIYKIFCKSCKQNYIGSTIRRLHDRIKEHFTQKTSSIYKHQQKHTNKNINETYTIKILHKDTDTINLRIKEAIIIRKMKPQINSREELNELDFILTD